MAFGLRQFAQGVGEFQRLHEILEPELPVQLRDARLVNQRPVIHRRVQLRDFGFSDVGESRRQAVHRSLYS